MLKQKVISLHSSRGGTGKTIIATNLAAIFARRGINVALLDLDFRAPSLHMVFSKGIKEPIEFWLNDFLDGRCTISQVLIDVSRTYGFEGKLLVGLANPAAEAVRGVAEKSRSWEVSAVKKLFSLRSSLFDSMNMNYCLFDTSPGIQHTSINAVVSSDLAVIVATLDSIDVAGVKTMLAEFYEVFEKKNAVIVNKVFPENRIWSPKRQVELIQSLEKTFSEPVIGIIPCYCDVLQADRSTLLAVDNPDHPFLKKLEEVAQKLELV